MLADRKVYVEAIAILENSTGEAFERALKRTERAQLAFDTARDRLDAHIAAHDCE